MKYKQISISPESFEQLEKLAEKWDMNFKDFTENAITYFRLTGEDPTANRKDNIVKSMKELQNTFISFIRTHEKDHLVKLVTDFDTTRRNLEADNDRLSKYLAGRMGDLLINGVELKSGEKWSASREFVKIGKANKEQQEKLVSVEKEVITAINSAKNATDSLKTLIEDTFIAQKEEKRQFIESEINKKIQEVDSWMVPANKEKAKQTLSDLKTLIHASY